jgi:hypothetical protein
MVYYKSWPGFVNNPLNAASQCGMYLSVSIKKQVERDTMQLFLYQNKKKTQYKFLHETFYCKYIREPQIQQISMLHEIKLKRSWTLSYFYFETSER